MAELNETLNKFQPVSLSEMDEVKLMNRTETKFVFAASQLPTILNDLSSDYRVLEIDGVNKSAYNTLYFDTEELKFYMQHHNGKLNRQKVRIRKYVGSNQSYIEVKTKSNKGRTIKKRTKEKELSKVLSESALKFIEKHVDVNSKEIIAQLWNSYNRITLTNIESKERVTIDLDLEFDDNGKKVKIQEMVIAEVKQEKYNVQSPFIQKMRSMHIRPMRMSKYCIGIVLLKSNVKSNGFREGMKYNKFKERLLTIEKLKDGSN